MTKSFTQDKDRLLNSIPEVEAEAEVEALEQKQNSTSNLSSIEEKPFEYPLSLPTLRNHRHGFFGRLSRCTESLRRSRLPLFAATTSLATISSVLDFVCTQNIEQGKVDWDYFTDEPSRLVWFISDILGLGLILGIVIRSMKTEIEENVSNRAAVLKAIFFTTLYSFCLSFAKNALNAPISAENSGAIIGSAFSNGFKGGTYLCAGNYFLKKFNFTIRPLTCAHLRLISAGIVLAAMQDILDFVFKQMIKEKPIDMDAYIFPARVFIWHAIIVSIQGTMLGLVKSSFNKYADLNTVDHAFNKVQKGLFITMPIGMTLTVFADTATTETIDEENALAIVGDSIVKGGFYGLVIATNMCAFFGVQRHYQRSQLLSSQEAQNGPSV